MNEHSSRLTAAIRGDRDLAAAVRALVASAPLSTAARDAWAGITRHPRVVEAVTREMVYSSALDLGMQFHPARSQAMEAV